MKKVISILFCVLMVSTQVYAQQWVSTSPQNKNVILEEFTGIYCQFCPDGHRIASEIAEANPGRVFLINIHAGNYAANHGYAGYIDLQTPEGTALDAASNNTYGYPGGSVNRNTSPSWIMGRDQWASAAATVMAQASPVNVFVKSSVDLDTRKLTTEVEFYYTDNSTSNKNYLTVMLTQDNILGPQVDGGNYNPTNWTWDGLYRHNHALRKVLTSGGAFGESIDTTTKGHYEYRKYVTDLPAAINSINVELFRLKSEAKLE